VEGFSGSIGCSAGRPRFCYGGVTVVLHWCYSGITVGLQWCYSGITGSMGGSAGRPRLAKSAARPKSTPALHSVYDAVSSDM
jgi:hypothetical protein